MQEVWADKGGWADGGKRQGEGVWILSFRLHQQIRGPGRLHLDDLEVVAADDEEDLCIVETYGWVHLTSHNMHTADVTDHFLVHLWEKSPRFHGVPGCQPSTFFSTFSTNNRIQGVCSVWQFQRKK